MNSKMKKTIISFAAAFMLSCTMPAAVYADTSKPYTYTEIEKTLAPIALYPDSLLGNVMVASTFPDQIVEADEWYKSNGDVPASKIGELTKYKKWDESVVSLLTVTPDVINFMAEDLDWTYKLADIFTNQSDQMYDTLQKLRNAAYSKGAIKSNENVIVTKENNYIYIKPADPNVIVVPTYDAAALYGYNYNLSGNHFAYTAIDAAITWGTFTLLDNLFYGSSWDWANRHMWWGPGYSYYHYGPGGWVPWYDRRPYGPPPPPPPPPKPYHPVPPPPRPHHDQHHDKHHHDHHHRPDPRPHSSNSPVVPHNGSGIVGDDGRKRHSINNGVVGGSSRNRTADADKHHNQKRNISSQNGKGPENKPKFDFNKTKGVNNSPSEHGKNNFQPGNRPKFTPDSKNSGKRSSAQIGENKSKSDFNKPKFDFDKSKNGNKPKSDISRPKFDTDKAKRSTASSDGTQKSSSNRPKFDFDSSRSSGRSSVVGGDSRRSSADFDRALKSRRSSSIGDSSSSHPDRRMTPTGHTTSYTPPSQPQRSAVRQSYQPSYQPSGSIRPSSSNISSSPSRNTYSQPKASQSVRSSSPSQPSRHTMHSTTPSRSRSSHTSVSRPSSSNGMIGERHKRR